MRDPCWCSGGERADLLINLLLLLLDLLLNGVDLLASLTLGLALLIQIAFKAFLRVGIRKKGSASSVKVFF
jgi:hypothetical protein